MKLPTTRIGYASSWLLQMKDLGVNDCEGQRTFAETGAEVDLMQKYKELQKQMKDFGGQWC